MYRYYASRHASSPESPHRRQAASRRRTPSWDKALVSRPSLNERAIDAEMLARQVARHACRLDRVVEQTDNDVCSSSRSRFLLNVECSHTTSLPLRPSLLNCRSQTSLQSHTTASAPSAGPKRHFRMLLMTILGPKSLASACDFQIPPRCQLRQRPALGTPRHSETKLVAALRPKEGRTCLYSH